MSTNAACRAVCYRPGNIRAWVARFLAFFSARFALRDWPDFLLSACRGDLSAMALPGAANTAAAPHLMKIGTAVDRIEGAELPLSRTRHRDRQCGPDGLWFHSTRMRRARAEFHALAMPRASMP